MKRRIGPRLSKPRAQTSALMVRLTDEELRMFQQRAALVGLKTSTWARMTLLREIREPSGERREPVA